MGNVVEKANAIGIEDLTQVLSELSLTGVTFFLSAQLKGATIKDLAFRMMSVKNGECVIEDADTLFGYLQISFKVDDIVQIGTDNRSLAVIELKEGIIYINTFPSESVDGVIARIRQ